MKVFVLTDHFGNGGAERVASLIINGLSNDTCNEVHVCVFENINNYNVQFERVCFHLLTSEKTFYVNSIFIRIRNLIKLIRTEKPDVIFSFGPIMASYVYIARKISGIKKVRIISSERNDPRKEPVSNMKKIIRDFCYRRSDVIVCQTPLAVELLKKRNVHTKYVIISNPISPDLPVWKGINSKEIITAARLTEQKNLLLLINAFEKLHEEFPEYRLVIYGDGEQRNILEDYVMQKKMSDVIHMPGFVRNIHQVMTNSYMYVSSSDYEGISNSMLEALGIGLPCVCTDCPVGGAALNIENGKNGFLTKVGDCDSLFQAMRTLVVDKSLALRFSQNSTKINEKLSLEKITKLWMSLVDNNS